MDGLRPSDRLLICQGVVRKFSISGSEYCPVGAQRVLVVQPVATAMFDEHNGLHRVRAATTSAPACALRFRRDHS